MALAGNIKEFSLADIFQIISLQQKTGELFVKGSEGSVTIIFERGVVIGADASFRQVESRLGQVLVRSGKITKFQLKRALDKQKKTLQPLGTILAELGDVDIESLRQALSQQIQETIYHLLRWTDGEYKFTPKKSVEYDKNLIKPINTEFLVMEGFRITDEWPEIEKRIPSFQVVVRRVPGASLPNPDEVESMDSGEEVKISENQKKIFDLLESERTIQDLIDMSHLGEFDTCQTVYALMTQGLVEKVPEEEVKKKPKEISSMGYPGLTEKLYVSGGILMLGLILWIGFQFGLKNSVFLYSGQSPPGLQFLKEESAKSELTKMQGILTAYYVRYRHYPASLDELVIKGFIREHDLYDPWGHKYLWTKTETGLVLSSVGPDGKAQTKDDILGSPLTGSLLF
jgi:hypothetical protein